MSKIYNFFRAAALLFPAVCFSSCSLINDIKNFEKPETVSVKFDGQKYSVPLGNATSKLMEHASAEKIQEIIDENINSEDSSSTVNVYEYDDSSDTGVQKYIFDYSIADVPLDVSDWLSKLDNMDLDTVSQNFTRKIQVPALGDMDFSQSEELDFNAMVGDLFNGTISLNNIPESGTEKEITWPAIDFSIDNPDFDYMIFKNGSMNLTFKVAEGSTPSDDYKVQAKAVLMDSSGNLISSSGDDYVTVITGSTSSNILSVPVGGQKIYKDLKVQFSMKVSGGENVAALHLNNYQISLDLSDDAKISQVYGLTVSDDDLASSAVSITKTVDTSAARSTLKSATVGSGTMEYYLKVPSGWSGITTEPSISMTGGLNVSDSDFETVSAGSEYVAYRRADLAGKEIFSGDQTDIEVSGSIPFHVSDATIIFNYDESGNCADKIVFDAKTTISEFKDAKISISDVADDSEFSKSYNQILDENIVKFIRQINFISVGLTGTITTDLPQSDLKINVDLSADTGIFDGLSLSKSVVFDEEGKGTLNLVQTYDEDVLSEEEGIKGKKAVLAENAAVAFNVKMSVDSAADDSSVVTFESVVPGTEYNLNCEIGFEYNWYSIVVNPVATELNGSIDCGINFNSFLGDGLNSSDAINDIIDNVAFKSDSIDGYVFVTAPKFGDSDETNIFNEFAGLQGSATIDYEGVDASNSQIFPIPGESDVIKFVATKDTLSTIADENRIIKSLADVPTSCGLNGGALVNAFNVKPEDETINYSFNLSTNAGEDGITVKKSGLESLKNSGGSTSIGISLAVVISLKLEVTSDIVISDVLGTFGSGIDEDLLGRESADEKSDYKKYADLIQVVYLDYGLTNNMGFNVTAGITAANEAGETYLQKEIVLNKASQKLSFSDKDIDNMFNNYPFIPLISLTIAKGDVIIPQNASFSANAVITAVTSGNYTIWGGDDDE